MDAIATYSCNRRVLVRCLASTVLASGTLLAVPTVIPAAHAELVGCRSDPTVVLSNGAIIDLSAAISDSANDVQSVTYTLHGPAGSHIVAVINTTGLLGLKEAFTFVADQPARTYISVTSATTGITGVTVAATTAIIPLLDLPTSGTASGEDRQDLTIHLST